MEEINSINFFKRDLTNTFTFSSFSALNGVIYGEDIT